MSRATAVIVSLGAGAWSAIRTANVWNDLPLRMASHYDAMGRPNGWMWRGDFFVMYGGIFGALVLLFVFMPSLIGRLPKELVNVPHREYWLQGDRWQEAIGILGRELAWFGAAFSIFGAGILELVLRSNLTKQPLASGPMWGLLAAFMVGTVVWLVRLQRVLRPPADGAG